MDEASQTHVHTVRETVESIWIAIVLAFVLRAFVIEAFVIPTGSMAPRLMGQHWQVDCPACGCHYAYGAPGQAEGNVARGRLTATCPNCRFQVPVDVSQIYSGDRVLVLKYLYRFKEPRPWDVVVFKNPRDNDQNYIKRLIGLPGQLVEIVHGDVYVVDGKDLNGDGVIDQKDFDLSGPEGVPDGVIDYYDYDSPQWKANYRWRILTKPDRVQQVMWQGIYDNDLQPDPKVYNQPGHAWQPPWQLDKGWKPADDFRVFRFDGGQPARMDCHHGVSERFLPKYAYNLDISTFSGERQPIVSDLKLSFQFVPRDEAARVAMELSAFAHHFRASVGADGKCILEHGLAGENGDVTWDDKPWGTQQISALAAGGEWDLALTNVDYRVTLWVNGKAVIETTDAQYPADHDVVERMIRKFETGGEPAIPTPTVAVIGQAGKLEIRHLDLMRDVYYTSPMISGGMSGPPGHGTIGNPMVLRKYAGNPDMDEFFVLGDNSPQSLDGRLWDSASPTLREGYRLGTVPRYNMIGRAFFVYWPGGYRLPYRDIPLVPNVGRMRLIR